MIINYSDQEVIKGQKSIILANKCDINKKNEILPLNKRLIMK